MLPFLKILIKQVSNLQTALVIAPEVECVRIALDDAASMPA
jgi:hypothetical protein